MWMICENSGLLAHGWFEKSIIYIYTHKRDKLAFRTVNTFSHGREFTHKHTLTHKHISTIETTLFFSAFKIRSDDMIIALGRNVRLFIL